jgi:2-hydroxycyclohexanecarboxyl-CoA dehydrogenase
MGRLDGKVAAVTGGASGIGEATVRRFVAEGASVAFCDRDGERGQRVAAEFETAGAKVAFTQADVGTEAACLAFINGAAQKFGRLDILINNAGIRKYEKVDEASAASNFLGRVLSRGERPPDNEPGDDDQRHGDDAPGREDHGVWQPDHIP